MNKITSAARRKVYLTSLLIASTLLTLLAALTPMLQSSFSAPLEAGEIAARDYRAQEAVSFTSEVLTQQRRDLVERSVALIYTPPDTRVARRQLEQLRAALAYINSVRADAFATADQKLGDLDALDDIRLEKESAEAILSMSDARWQEIQQEAIAVLEKVMSSPIRPESLVEARNRVPALVSLALPEDQAAIAAELAMAYVSANSSYSESLTQTARLSARSSVDPIVRTFVPGQTIVLQGEVLTAENIEALQQLGLTIPQGSLEEQLGAVLISLLMIALMVLYLRRKNILAAAEPRSLGLLAALQLTFLIAARLILPLNSTIAYAFPLASCALVTAALFGTELALVSSIPLAALATYGLVNSFEMVFFFLISSLFGVLALGRARRLITFLWAGLAIAVSGMAVVLIFRLPQASANLELVGVLSSAAFFNGLVSASFSILLHSFLAPFLGQLTPMQLLDLTRPDHPLLGVLLRDAPGTYQHSLQVANLAEQAAERIGVDPLLIRAGALYHDIGKAANPAFFIENQPPGFENPHNNLVPEESACVIIAHVMDGLKLARKYRLPRRIHDFITEHHGTTITNYQYYNAVKAAGGDESLVDKEPFRYPGPRPQSRETAMLMLADACEARVRAERPVDDDILRSLITSIISGRMSSGQLDHTRLTMQDYHDIAASFTATLRGIYHPRLTYPNPELPAAHDAITIPAGRKVESPVEAFSLPNLNDQR
jgi:hypothetical protein